MLFRLNCFFFEKVMSRNFKFLIRSTSRNSYFFSFLGFEDEQINLSKGRVRKMIVSERHASNCRSNKYKLNGKNSYFLSGKKALLKQMWKKSQEQKINFRDLRLGEKCELSEMENGVRRTFHILFWLLGTRCSRQTNKKWGLKFENLETTAKNSYPKKRKTLGLMPSQNGLKLDVSPSRL